VGTLKPSVTVAITNRAKQLVADGVDVLGFAAGEPDFDTPAAIKRAAIAALEAGQTKYMPTLGDMATRTVIAEKLVQENGIAGLTGGHVAISAGGKHALFIALHCLLDAPAAGGAAGEAAGEVILPVPAWVSYRPIAELAGGRVVEVETSPAGGYKMTPEQLEAAITPASRVLILNSPSNPCGTMYSEAELRAFAAVVARAAASTAPNLVVLTDEIYEKIVYGPDAHFSIGSVPEIAERTLTINGLSKAYAMTGWRIGYAAMPGEFGLRFIRAMGTLQGQMTTNITSFCYPAIRTALTDEGVAGEVARMREAFARRAALMDERLAAIPGVSCPRPTGAFYAFVDVSAHFGRITAGGRVIGSALDLSEALLDEARIAFVPGEDFGGCGGDCVRISFACGEDQINRGMDRLARFVGELR
jgi:aspartate aminotransferase